MYFTSVNETESPILLGDDGTDLPLLPSPPIQRQMGPGRHVLVICTRPLYKFLIFQLRCSPFRFFEVENRSLDVFVFSFRLLILSASDLRSPKDFRWISGVIISGSSTDSSLSQSMVNQRYFSVTYFNKEIRIRKSPYEMMKVWLFLNLESLLPNGRRVQYRTDLILS